MSGQLITFLVGGIMLAAFFFLYRANTKTADRIAGPKRRVSYECVVTPVQEADADLLQHFPELDDLPSRDGIELIRLGVFNWGELELEAAHVQEPITVRFPQGTEVLSVTPGETFKTELDLPEPPQAAGNVLTFPAFAIAPRGTVIFNVMVRGTGKPDSVTGLIEGCGEIRRLG